MFRIFEIVVQELKFSFAKVFNDNLLLHSNPMGADRASVRLFFHFRMSRLAQWTTTTTYDIYPSLLDDHMPLLQIIRQQGLVMQIRVIAVCSGLLSQVTKSFGFT